MPLRNQPYLPLYVQDFLTDEKLIECSAQATGVYIRLMCIMHKSEPYGTILLKQKDKQNGKQIKNFALKLAKFLPYDLGVIENSLDELVSEGVLILDDNKLYQKRMVKDDYLSSIRAKSGSKGGKFAQAKVKAKHQANTEDEIVIEIENEIDNIKKEGGVGEEKKYSGFIESLFHPVKDVYFQFYYDKVGVYPENFIDDDLKSLLIKITGSMKSSGEQLHTQSVIQNFSGLLQKLPKFWLGKLNIKTINNNYDSIIAEIKSKSGGSQADAWKGTVDEYNRRRKATTPVG